VKEVIQVTCTRDRSFLPLCTLRPFTNHMPIHI